MDLFEMSVIYFVRCVDGKRTVLDSMALIVALDAILWHSPASPFWSFKATKLPYPLLV